MKKKASKIAAFAVSLAAAFGSFSLSASAETIEDVCNALRDIGIPESQVQACMNYYFGSKRDENGVWDPRGKYRTYEDLVDIVYLMQDDIRERITDVLLSAASTTKATNQKSSSTTTATTAKQQSGETKPAETQKPFIKMTLEEKKAYVNSLPAEKRTEFINGLSTEERNDIIKQLPTADKAQLAQGFIDMMKEFGLNMTVDDIQGNNLDVSVRDQNGTLVDSSSIGTKVEDTGWNLTAPFTISLAALLASVGGLTWLAIRGQKENENA